MTTPSISSQTTQAPQSIPTAPSSPELFGLAKRVIDALVDNGLAKGWTGDTSDAYRKGEVERLVALFNASEKNLSQSLVSSDVCNLALYTKIDKQDIEAYAKHLGCAIQWKRGDRNWGERGYPSVSKIEAYSNWGERGYPSASKIEA